MNKKNLLISTISIFFIGYVSSAFITTKIMNDLKVLIIPQTVEQIEALSNFYTYQEIFNALVGVLFSVVHICVQYLIRSNKK